MISDGNRLFDRVASYEPCRESSLSADGKIETLDAAIVGAVRKVYATFNDGERVHLAYSGGVDSSIVLYYLVNLRASVTAHTMVNTVRHPDLVHARQVIKTLRRGGYDVKHAVHILSPTTTDTAESNRLLGVEHDSPDNYYMLMKTLAPHTSRVVSCDCIDELLGGYHMHRNPERYFPFYDENMNCGADRFAVLKHYIVGLLSDHLVPFQKCSDHFGIKVHLPYGDVEVMKACRCFSVSEMVDDERRKKPVYEIASRLGVPNNVLTRRKYGLISAFHEVVG